MGSVALRVRHLWTTISRSLQRDEIFDRVRSVSARHREQSLAISTELQSRLLEIFPEDQQQETARSLDAVEPLHQVIEWLQEQTGAQLNEEAIIRLPGSQVQRVLQGAVDDRFHPEMRRMERALLLQLLDSAWKDHLLAMDHLRSSIGLVGYAQVDPKVEYKREGMKLFDQMWISRRRADYGPDLSHGAPR